MLNHQVAATKIMRIRQLVNKLISQQIIMIHYTTQRDQNHGRDQMMSSKAEHWHSHKYKTKT